MHPFPPILDSPALEKPVCVQFTHCRLQEQIPICGKTISAQVKEKDLGDAN